jgi:hypothetical protein
LTLDLKEDDLPRPSGAVAKPSEWTRKVKLAGSDHVRLRPDAVEDIWILAEYSVQA